ncbi:MAG: 3'(2'),5'-bisphosphate nucleotidase CysQ [Bacteroidia bacterium]
MTPPLHTLLYNAIVASVEAGREILKVYDTDFSVEYKEDHTPLTMADQKASNRIIELLASKHVPVMSEEGEHFSFEKRKDLDQLWIVDPLDGTKEFVKRNGEFTVNIALVKAGQPVIGVIYSPVFKDLYFACKDLGAFKIDRHTFIPLLENLHAVSLEQLIGQAKRLPAIKQRDGYIVVASRSHMSSETYTHIADLKLHHPKVEIVNTGSSIKMCWVAEGIADEYPRFGPTMEWDTAAGQAILENAGCELIDIMTNKPMEYNRPELKNNWFVARRKFGAED